MKDNATTVMLQTVEKLTRAVVEICPLRRKSIGITNRQTITIHRDNIQYRVVDLGQCMIGNLFIDLKIGGEGLSREGLFPG